MALSSHISLMIVVYELSDLSVKHLSSYLLHFNKQLHMSCFLSICLHFQSLY